MSFRFALTSALAVMSGHALAQSTDTTQEKPLDPVMMALMGCHFDYAKSNSSSKAAPTEIATAVMAVCQSQFNAAGEDTFNNIDNVIQFRNMGTKQPAGG